MRSAAFQVSTAVSLDLLQQGNKSHVQHGGLAGRSRSFVDVKSIGARGGQNSCADQRYLQGKNFVENLDAPPGTPSDSAPLDRRDRRYSARGNRATRPANARHAEFAKATNATKKPAAARCVSIAARRLDIESRKHSSALSIVTRDSAAYSKNPGPAWNRRAACYGAAVASGGWDKHAVMGGDHRALRDILPRQSGRAYTGQKQMARNVSAPGRLTRDRPNRGSLGEWGAKGGE